MRGIRICVVILVISVLLMPFACAASEGIVDVQALKLIEESDDFPIKITNKQIERDAGGISIEGSDLLNITIQNNSDSKTSKINLYLIAYDENDKQYNLGLLVIGYEPQSFGGDIVIEKGGEKTVSIRCRAENIAGVRAIILSYTDNNGNTYENPNAVQWYDQAYIGEKKETRTFD